MAPGRKKEDATGAVHELAGKGVLVIYATPSNEHILASIFAQVRPPRNFFMIRQCDCLSAPIFLAGNCSRQYPMQQMPPASADTTLAFDVVPKLESSLCFHNETIVEDQNKSLARELATLANDERQAILEEVHGVCAPIVEEFEFLTSKQRELTVEVTKIQRKTAYNRARFLCPQFVNDPRLLSQFLRADGFDTKEAAKRLIRFFETKQYLWGEEALVKRITLDDLTRYDIAAMQAGAFRVTLPDRAGRPLMLLVVKSLNYRTIKDQVRRSSLSTIAVSHEICIILITPVNS